MYGQIRFLGEVLPEQSVGVFIRSTLPGTLRIAEVDGDVGRQSEAFVVRHLQTAVPGQRSIEHARQLPGVLYQCRDDGRGVLARDLGQHHIARVPLHQRDDVSVVRSR